LRISDFLTRLNVKNINDGFIKIKTFKTNTWVTIPIHPQVDFILKKRNGSLPSKISEQKLSKKIKLIAQLCNIDVEMIDLKQKELDQWQAKNFGRHNDDMLKCALGMAEEVGEVCHHVLKGTQKIRGGVNGINKKEVADGVADALIYGIQLLSVLGIDAEKEITVVISKVLSRSWVDDPSGAGFSAPCQLEIKVPY